VDDFDGTSQRLRLDPGEHEIELYLDGHRPRRERVMFTRGNTLRLRYTMEPLAAGEPPAARPKPAPAPPRSAPPAAVPGEPESAQPGARYPGEAEPSNGLAIERRAPRAAFGSLQIRVQPGDAEIVIDGEGWASPDPRRALIVQLSEGTHRVEVRKRGFTTFTSEVTIQRGETTTLNVSLLQSDRNI
jgi:PEGA domain